MHNSWSLIRAISATASVGVVFSMLFSTSSCTSEATGPSTGMGTGLSYGTFQVSLVAPTDFNPTGYTQVSGKVSDGPNPIPVNWVGTDTVGSCILLIPFTPSCATPCGSNGTCVTNNETKVSSCKEYAKDIPVGTVTVTGLKTKAGETTFSMNPVNKYYQQPAGTTVVFPPFAPGETVTMKAAGDSATAGFTLTGKGIAPLDVTQDSILLADGQPVQLQWAAGTTGNTRLSLEIDISHHGGSKGKIACEGPDNGSLTIAATLVDKLKALGMAGYPKMDVKREAVTTAPNNHVDLVLSSGLTLPLSIPGLISCGDNTDCPDGQTCQQNLTCK
jgi:hypothetical protein